MQEHLAGAVHRRPVTAAAGHAAKAAVFLCAAILCLALAQGAAAQSYRFTSVEIEGNQRVSGATILSYAGIGRGETLTAGQLNDAYQSIVDSGLFETVEIVPQGNRLVIRVAEYPTINLISFEGNRTVKDDDLASIVRSQSRRVYNPAVAEADAAAIVGAYEQGGRLAATVDPKIIRRSDNRVDLVFEITEGKAVEIERLSFVGNRTYSDRRLRRVLQTKQAGILRALVRRDTFVADRIEFDKQVLRDFYLSRGYVDFQVLSVTSELTRRRDAFLLTFNIREGQSFDFGAVTAVSDLPEVDPDEFQAAIAVKPGMTYSPVAVETTIARLERLAIRKGLDFIRIDPRITRNDRDLTLDVEFAIVRGPRIFVERIDIEGNATTLDRVVRRQFRSVEGDPFNPREIRESAERIRALGFFSQADVEAREGTSPDTVIVDVNVEEQPTGSLGFGLSYSASSGAGAAITFSERNFLGRGQALRFSLNTGTDNAVSRLSFTEPAFLGRNVAFSFNALYAVTDKENDELFRTHRISVGPSLTFPLSESTRLELRYTLSEDRLYDYSGASAIIAAEAVEETLISSSVGYTLSYDSRTTGLDPNSGVRLSFSQDFAGLGGDREYIETSALASAQTRVFSEEVTLRAEVEGGVLHMLDGNSRITDRYFLNGKIRGFEPNGLGPRDPETRSGEALGGNMYAVARFEAEFPVGLPEEYGITGGLFADFGSVWSLDNTNGGAVDDDFNLRSAVGVSVFWTTPIGPLRFNFSKAIQKEDYDDERTFDLTISTRF